ncbi:MAG: dockerin type I domain-containing protein, partial [Candidatus Zixiibacteriota bacterium]
AFSFESVPATGPYPNNRYTLMRRIMDWFGIGKSIPQFMHGDVNGDQIIDAGDVVFLINYLFKGAAAPYPLDAGDANCDGRVDSGDVIYLINYLYKAGPVPPC